MGFVELDDLALDQINGGCDQRKTSCSGSTGGNGTSIDLLGPGSASDGGQGGTVPCRTACERDRDRCRH